MTVPLLGLFSNPLSSGNSNRFAFLPEFRGFPLSESSVLGGGRYLLRLIELGKSGPARLRAVRKLWHRFNVIAC